MPGTRCVQAQLGVPTPLKTRGLLTLGGLPASQLVLLPLARGAHLGPTWGSSLCSASNQPGPWAAPEHSGEARGCLLSGGSQERRTVHTSERGGFGELSAHPPVSRSPPIAHL